MNTTITTKKTSLVKQAAWMAILDAAVIISNITILIKRQIHFTAKDYQGFLPIPMLISLVALLVLISVALLAMAKTKNTENGDELSALNRYKAGYISKHILVVAFIAAIWFIRDFGFAFTDDLLGNLLSLPLIIIMFAHFVENITFIILEKLGLE